MPIITKPDKFRTSQINCRIIAKIKELRPGVTRYFFDSVDVATKFGFSYYFNKQTSQNMVNFYEMFKKVFPYFSLNLKSPLQYILINYKMANMCLTNTIICKIKSKLLQFCQDSYKS